MLRLVRRRASSGVTVRSNQKYRKPAPHGRERGRGGETSGREQDRDQDPPVLSRNPNCLPPQRDPGQAPGEEGREDPVGVHHRALRRVLALPEGRGALHRRPPGRGRVPDRRGARPPSQHFVLDRRPLLPGSRLRGLSGASAGRDRGVPRQSRCRRERQRLPVRLRPLRVRGIARRRPRRPRGHGPQPDQRAGRGLRVGPGRREPRDDRRHGSARVLRELPAPPAGAPRHPRRGRRQPAPGLDHPAQPARGGRAGHRLLRGPGPPDLWSGR